MFFQSLGMLLFLLIAVVATKIDAKNNEFVSEQRLLVSLAGQNAALCGLIAATDIATIPEYSMWSCDADGSTSTNVCSPEWEGIFCSDEEVISLNIGNGLHGTIPSAFGSLLSVTHINIAECSLHGSLPLTIGSLTALSSIYLDDNSFSGNLPTTLGSLVGLIELSVVYNRFNGSVPVTLGSLTKLEMLQLSENCFSGSLPDMFSEMISLTELYFHDNSLTGMLPSTLAVLTSLNNLAVGVNMFSGPVPSFLGSMSSLVQLELQNNSFTGTISTALCADSAFSTLDFSGNLQISCYAECLNSVPNLINQQNISTCDDNNNHNNNNNSTVDYRYGLFGAVLIILVVSLHLMYRYWRNGTTTTSSTHRVSRLYDEEEKKARVDNWEGTNGGENGNTAEQECDSAGGVVAGGDSAPMIELRTSQSGVDNETGTDSAVLNPMQV